MEDKRKEDEVNLKSKTYGQKFLLSSIFYLKNPLY